MNYFAKGAALSSIHIRFSEDKPVGITIPEEDFDYDDDNGNDNDDKRKWSPLKTIKKAGDALGRLFATFIDSFIYAVVIGVPLLGVVWCFHWLVLKRSLLGSRDVDNAV